MVQLHHHKNSAAELILIPFSLIVKEATYNEGLELAHLLIHIRFPIPISSDVVAFHQIARLFFEFDRALMIQKRSLRKTLGASLMIYSMHKFFYHNTWIRTKHFSLKIYKYLTGFGS